MDEQDRRRLADLFAHIEPTDQVVSPYFNKAPLRVWQASTADRRQVLLFIVDGEDENGSIVRIVTFAGTVDYVAALEAAGAFGGAFMSTCRRKSAAPVDR